MKDAAAKARNASLLGLKSAQITALPQKLNGYRTVTRKQTQTIKELEDQIRDTRTSSTPDPFEISIDRIFTDLNQNREQAPTRRRYSFDTLTWAREIVTESPAAYRTIRRIVPLPLERLLQERFTNFQLRVRYALTDIEDMDFLTEIWPETNGIEQVTGSIPVILSVEAVAFRPRITIDGNGKVEGLKGFAQLKTPDILANLFSIHAPSEIS